jgi:mono/diheme cytochrome c family protein
MAELNGLNSVQGIRVTANGNVPYYYGNTDAERARAIAEIKANPFAVTKVGLEKGKQLYDIYCGICHGTKGDGAGYLVADENRNAKYPNQPANLLQDEFIAASNGRYYHAIMHGKGVMGGYADKLSYEERWQVIHHIRSMQATAKGKDYLKGEVATAVAVQTAAQPAVPAPATAPATQK